MTYTSEFVHECKDRGILYRAAACYCNQGHQAFLKLPSYLGLPTYAQPGVQENVADPYKAYACMVARHAGRHVGVTSRAALSSHTYGSYHCTQQLSRLYVDAYRGQLLTDTARRKSPQRTALRCSSAALEGPLQSSIRFAHTQHLPLCCLLCAHNMHISETARAQ